MRGKEFSEHELVALSAVDGAINNGAVRPVYITSVRRQRKSNKLKGVGGLEACIVEFEFAFRRFAKDGEGIARAQVSLSRILVGDLDCPTHNYYVWAPSGGVKITLRSGGSLVKSQRSFVHEFFGDRKVEWLEIVESAQPSNA